MWIAPWDNLAEAVEVEVPSKQPTRQEKNWIFWCHNNEVSFHFLSFFILPLLLEFKAIYASYSIKPHVILHVNPFTGNTAVIYNTSLYEISDAYYPFLSIPTKYHLGTPCIRIQSEHGTFYWLAIFHAKWEGPPGAYKHYVYTFADSPPFAIQRVSQIEFTLPCTTGQEVVLVSCLERLGYQALGSDQEVMLGYGVNDEELHYAVTTLKFLEKDLVAVQVFGPHCFV